jgi:RNA polymerase subunit RPABC4/transcription elongation factor Spt4
MTIDAIIARGFQLLLALTGAYTIALWFALIVWTFRDIESRSRSVVAQIFSTLLVVLFFIPGALIYFLLRPKETLDDTFGRALEEEYLLQDLEDLSLCPNCHRPVQDDFVACPHCFTELRHTCHSCNRLVDVSWSICAYCTAELVTVSDEIEGPPVQEERPSILPLPLRLLRERTEVRLEHLLSPDHEGKLPEGQPSALIARETQAAGAWTDDSGKDSWFLSRAREVFATPAQQGPTTPEDGHDHAHASNGSANPTGKGQAASTNGHHAAHDEAWAAEVEQARVEAGETAMWTGAEELPTGEITSGTMTRPQPTERVTTTSRELYSYRPAKKKRSATPPVEGEEE